MEFISREVESNKFLRAFIMGRFEEITRVRGREVSYNDKDVVELMRNADKLRVSKILADIIGPELGLKIQCALTAPLIEFYDQIIRSWNYGQTS